MNDRTDEAMTAARALTSVSGQTPAGVERVLNGEEAVRTLRFHPDLARIETNTTVQPARIDVTPSSLVSTLQTDLAALTARVVVLETLLAGRIVRTATGLEFTDSAGTTLFEYGITDGNAKAIGFFDAGLQPRPSVSESSGTLAVDIATALNGNKLILKGA